MYQFIENIKSDKSFLFYRGRNALYALLKAMGIGQSDVDLSYRKRVIAFQEKRLFRKLDKFNSMVAYQKWVVSQYDELLSQTGYDLLELDGRFEPIYYKYPLLSDCKKVIFEKARQARIELSHYPFIPKFGLRRSRGLSLCWHLFK